MLHSVALPHPGPRVAGILVLVAVVAAACGASSGSPPAGSVPLVAASPSAEPSLAGTTPVPSSPRTFAASATPRASAATPTLKSFWAAVARGLAAAKHLQVTVAGPNPGMLRFEPAASATIVHGRVGFICLDGAAFDGQSAFARVPGTWRCGADALVSGFRLIGQPADSWSATSPTDASITESVGVAANGSWTWSYAGTSVFLGGKVTARVSVDATSGRILSARRVDPTGTTTYAFDYTVTFPPLAIPR